jgi:hypothetical protein
MFFLLLLALGLGAQPARAAADGPDNPVLAQKVGSLFQTIFETDDEAEEARAIAEVKAIYAQNGLLTTAEVGDEAAYQFVLLLASDKFPLSFRRQVLAEINEQAARLPHDAPEFYAARLRRAETRQQAASSPPANPVLRDAIERMYKADQAVRQPGGFNPRKMVKVDRSHTRALQAILDKYGVPTYSLVGPEAADDFVTMIQHQPARFRTRVLPQLEANVAAGQADPAAYALVYDRAQRDLGKKQLYGTQFECQAGEKLHLAPTLDKTHVNERRARLGHMRVELYAQVLAETAPQFCPPARPAVKK